MYGLFYPLCIIGCGPSRHFFTSFLIRSSQAAIVLGPRIGKYSKEGNSNTIPVFDSSYQRNEPIVFPLGIGRVIKGWDEGIALLKKGSSAKLVIPSELAYGSRGAGGVIPPNTSLIFEVELVDFR